MSKEEKYILDGVVTGVAKDIFYVQTELSDIVSATLAGKMRTNKIWILPGDQVTVEISPYEVTKGRILYRQDKKKEQTNE